MRKIRVKYLQKNEKTGSFVYRRRVPAALVSVVSQGEFFEFLGKSEGEALTNYGRIHESIEHLVALARNGVTDLTPMEQNARIAAQLEQWGADPQSPGFTDNERTWREEAAADLIEGYQHPQTGEYVGVPEGDGALARALLSGTKTASQRVTVRDAFEAYAEEHKKSTNELQKKFLQRLFRVEKALIGILFGNKALDEISRSDARKWRDSRLARVKPTTVQREKNDLSAVFNWAIGEMDGAFGTPNPFSNLKIVGGGGNGQSDREPMKQSVIDSVYLDLENTNKELLRIWTLLDFTGARPSEIRQLQVGDICLVDLIPHIRIQERSDRPLKNRWATRSVPLVGKALQVANDVANTNVSQSSPAFPKYSGEGGRDRLSQALSTRIRKYESSDRVSTYSLRHTMKDRLRAVEVFSEVSLFDVSAHRTNLRV